MPSIAGQREVNHRSRSSIFLLAVFIGYVPIAAHAQSVDRYYKRVFDNVHNATRSMINDLANATLDSACLTNANFERVTTNLDAESKATALRMRESGRRTLTDTKSWTTCKSQNEHINMLATDMSGAEMWNTQRLNAKYTAMLADNEEIEDGILIDHATKAPINSSARLALHISADTFLGGTNSTRGNFDALLTVSEDGLVTACEVISSTGNANSDGSMCRQAQLLLRYRPAFVNGRMAEATTHLRIGSN